MSRLPRKPARSQPPLRGRAATQPPKRLDPERPSVAAYRSPLGSPSKPQIGLVSSPSTNKGIKGKDIKGETIKEKARLGGLLPLWCWIGVLTMLLSLFILSSSILGR